MKTVNGNGPFGTLAALATGDLLQSRSAIISPCELFRYRLERVVGPGLTAAVYGVNPSKADHKIDDQTIRKLYGFGKRLSIGRWLVGNPFAYRATDVKELTNAVDPIGPDNDRHIEQIMRDADLHIVAWGPLSKLPPRLRHRWRAIANIAERVGCQLMCWGTAQDGHPRHPLMLAYDTPLVPWSIPGAVARPQAEPRSEAEGTQSP